MKFKLQINSEQFFSVSMSQILHKTHFYLAARLPHRLQLIL